MDSTVGKRVNPWNIQSKASQNKIDSGLLIDFPKIKLVQVQAISQKTSSQFPLRNVGDTGSNTRRFDACYRLPNRDLIVICVQSSRSAMLAQALRPFVCALGLKNNILRSIFRSLVTFLVNLDG